jgi:hypothetical protein
VDAATLLPWALRIAWVAMPFTAGPALAAALDGASRPVQAVASSGLWLGWAAAVAALLAPRSSGLTVARVVVPAGALATAAAAVAGEPSPVGLGVASVAAVLVLAPTTGAVFVDGSSYGDERRFPLRPPAALLLGPVELAWAVVVAGVAAGPLLLAARQWVTGGVALAAGLPAAAFAARSLHGLARRWVVLVPAGLVVHDPITLLDPVLLHRRVVRAVAPAPPGDGPLDLTAGAAGLHLVVALAEPVHLTLQRPGRRLGEPATATALRIAPTRPGAVLAEAARRRLPA